MLSLPTECKLPWKYHVGNTSFLPNFWRDSIKTETVYLCKYDWYCIGLNLTDQEVQMTAATVKRVMVALCVKYAKEGNSFK